MHFHFPLSVCLFALKTIQRGSWI